MTNVTVFQKYVKLKGHGQDYGFQIYGTIG